MLVPIADNLRSDRELTSFLVAGDPGCDGYNVEAIVILETILRQTADLHLLVGDLVPTGREKWFRQFSEIVDRGAATPVYALPGNHDLPEYADFLGRRDYFLRFPNALLVILDNARRYFTAETIDFLRATLAAEACPHVFIAFHIPPPNPFLPNNISAEEWEKIRDALEPHRARVRMIFCGHVHSAFDYPLDGYRVIVTGGGGARPDAVDNAHLPANGHHAFRLVWKEGVWSAQILDLRGGGLPAYGDTPADRRILADLAEGFAGEAQAHRRYLLFAERAEAEGFPNTARLFRAAAESEFHHSRNLLLASGEMRSTLDNVRASVAREEEEWSRLYPRFMQAACAVSSRRAVNGYDCALHAERVHHRLLQQAESALREGRDLPQAKYFTCGRCGFTHEGDHPPVLCPACGADRFKFAEVR